MNPSFANSPAAGDTVFRFHAMVKPAGGRCNLNCTYCYYLSKQTLLGQTAAPRISDEILEKHIANYIEDQTGGEVVFSWQGGEPTLLGLDFFRRAVELQKRHQKTGQVIQNDLQTNGTLLDQNWAQFLKEHNFLVGLSCDGPQKLHDQCRQTPDKRSTHAQVMAAAKLLQQCDVPFSVLCVVNRHNARSPYDVYRFLTRELGAKRIQLLPCVEPRNFEQTAPGRRTPDDCPVTGTVQARPGQPGSVVTDWSVDPEDWGYFLTKVWDDWFRRDYGKVFVDLFENVVTQAMGLPAQRCVTAEFCGKALALEHDGSVYSCDHFVYPEYRLGNLRDTPWRAMAYTERQIRFGLAKRDTLPEYCRQCQYLKVCWGGCPKDRFVRTPDGQSGLNYLCPGHQKFYAHIKPDMAKILTWINPN